MMIWEGTDKRRFPRVQIKCRVSLFQTGRDDYFETYTQNIGPGGVCVLLGREVELFKNAKLEIFISPDQEPVSCDGTVVWVIRRKNDLTGGFEYDTGIEFTVLTPKTKEKIAQFVSNFLPL
jgi:hypothetical protein